MKFIFNLKKFKWIRAILCILTLLFFLVSCHKSPGAICNDGHRSYSTGRGTCSWHGGVNHYIDTDEISVPKTTGLVLIFVLTGAALVNSGKKK